MNLGNTQQGLLTSHKKERDRHYLWCIPKGGLKKNINQIKALSQTSRSNF